MRNRKPGKLGDDAAQWSPDSPFKAAARRRNHHRAHGLSVSKTSGVSYASESAAKRRRALRHLPIAARAAGRTDALSRMPQRLSRGLLARQRRLRGVWL